MQIWNHTIHFEILTKLRKQKLTRKEHLPTHQLIEFLTCRNNPKPCWRNVAGAVSLCICLKFQLLKLMNKKNSVLFMSQSCLNFCKTEFRTLFFVCSTYVYRYHQWLFWTINYFLLVVEVIMTATTNHTDSLSNVWCIVHRITD